MKRLAALAGSLVRNLVSRKSLERDMHEEFQSHIALRADDLERRGLSREAAERAARVEFGGVEPQKEAARDARGLRPWNEVRANAAFAIRGIGHHPFQSLVVVVTLTLGLSIAAVVFSVMNALAFRARVDHDQATFTRILASFKTDTTPPSFPSAMPLRDYLAFAHRIRTLASMTGWQSVRLSLSAGARPTPGELVTCEFFAVYGPVRPVVGRLLERSDCDLRAPVAVIGNELWRSAFGADSSVVGRVLRINGQTVRIIGVAPTFSSASIDDELWLPYTVRGLLRLGPDDPASPNAMLLSVDGRLAPGMSRSDVAVEAHVVAAQQDRLVPGRHTTLFVTDGSLIMKPGNGLVVSGVLAAVFVGLACLALVACSSVVSILLAIADSRRVEMALRMALGAGAPRLAALLATESLMLAGIAGIVAYGLALRLPRVLIEWIVQRPLQFSLAPDWHVFVFLLVTTLLAALIAANAPIRAVLSLDLSSTLRGVSDDARAKQRNSNRLMTAEIGGAAALLVATIALTRLPARIADSPPRFDAKHLLATQLRAPQPQGGGGWRAFHDAMQRELASVDGVQGVAFATAQPVGDEATGAISLTTAEQTRRVLPWIEVSPSYFDVFRIRVERGRALSTSDADCAASVCPVLLSREAARTLWGTADPLGRHLTIDASHALEVVGVVADASSELAEPVQAEMVYTAWRPNAQLYQPFLHVNDAGGEVVRRVAAVVNERFAGAVAAPIAVADQLESVTAAFQRIGEAVGLMAAITAVLAIVGAYGVVAYAARRRLKEMGIRLALGARKRDVYRAMVAPNARPLILGVVVGVAFATGAAAAWDRWSAAIFPVKVTEPLTFVAAGLALGVVALAAMLVPAKRAASADPSAVLRQE